MERVQFLIEKLHTQKQAGATASQLLITVQLLQQELLQMQSPTASSSKRVAVIVPGFTASVLPVIETPIMAATSITEEKPAIVSIPEPVHQVKEFKPAQQQTFFSENAPSTKVSEESVSPYAPVAKEVVKQVESYQLQKPEQVQLEPVSEKLPEPPQYFNLAFDVMEETPTLVQHNNRQKELHELIGEKKDSLNDKLKQEKIELAHVLKDAPIKDLRKAIGVNDKFLFINELFRGDEGMYERSIKTINAFHILPEAEYWINRELKVKLGWNDSKETVQHFYQLVRRRFS
jgi:hypothetical protein